MTSLRPSRSALLAPYYPSLDGLRAIAVGLVFVIHFVGSHRNWLPVRWGWVGVDIFFVLSGFLITGILFDSLHRPDYFRNFYMRRTLRIFPLYYAVLILIALFGLLPHIHIFWNRYNLLYFLYLGNLVMPAGKIGLHPDITYIAAQVGDRVGNVIGIGHLWSLCVEEQFYLVWPAVIYFIRSRKALLSFCAVVIVIEPVCRVLYLRMHPNMILGGATYFVSWFRADTLLVGAAIALWLRGPAPVQDAIRRMSLSVFIGSVLGLVMMWILQPVHPIDLNHDVAITTVGYSLVAFAAGALLLWTIDPSTFIAKLLRNPVLIWFGRISYGLYLFHGFINTALLANIKLLHRLHLPGMSTIILGPLFTTLLAWLSFRFFESPFLALKPRLAPRPNAADDPPPFLEKQHNEPAAS